MFISHSSIHRKFQDHSSGRFSVWWEPTFCFIGSHTSMDMSGQSSMLQTFSCVLTWCKREGELSTVSLLRALTVIMGAPFVCLNHIPKNLPPNAIALGISISTYEFWGNTNILCVLTTFQDQAYLNKKSFISNRNKEKHKQWNKIADNTV